MLSWNYYLLSFLPTLGDLGTSLPMSIAELLDCSQDNPSACELLKAIVLEDELKQREAHLAGEIEEFDVSVLSEEQVRNESPLPEYLLNTDDDETESAVAVDQIWQGYFRYAMSIAQKESSTFLIALLQREIALRNALTEARAKTLQLDAQRYLVATDLADEEENFSSIINQWSSASSPLAGIQILERDRWTWLAQHDQWFTFKNDELVVYGAKLLVLRRWQRVAQAEPYKQKEPAESIQA